MIPRVVWVMLDGVGLADAGPSNPLAADDLVTLRALGVAPGQAGTSGPWLARAIDATLGVAGLPQSGTGQTTLLSGVNAAQAMGFHQGPWPGPSLKPLLEGSLPVALAAAGRTVNLANAYPERYRAAIATRRMRLNAIATAALAAGASLEDDGVSPTLGGGRAEAAGYGALLAAARADLTIFDAWYSDWLGHRGTIAEGRAYAARLDAFLERLLAERPPETLVLVTSDHGNFEDMGVKTHTRNPVPLVAAGPGAQDFAGVRDLAGIAGPLAALLGVRLDA